MSALLDWNRLVRKESANIKPSSILIGKIWTRLFFNLSSISEKHKALLGDNEAAHLGRYAIHTNAAKIMRFNVLAFLHAVLVEEDAYHRVDKNSSSNISVKFKQNPVTSVGQFVTKLGSMGDLGNLMKTHPIFSLIIKCPLIHPFLFPFGGINSADTKLLQEEKSLLDSLNKIIGGEFVNNVDFNKLETTDSSFSGEGCKNLHVTSIAAAPYDSKDAKKTRTSPPDEDTAE